MAGLTQREREVVNDKVPPKDCWQGKRVRVSYVSQKNKRGYSTDKNGIKEEEDEKKGRGIKGREAKRKKKRRATLGGCDERRETSINQMT